MEEMVRGIPLISSLHRTNLNSFASHWNLVVFAIGVICFILHLFFFYLPKDCGSTSICMDLNLGAYLSILRTLADVSFLCAKSVLRNMPPTLDVSDRGPELAKEQNHMVRDHPQSPFIIDFAATIPLPQVLIWYKIHTSDTSVTSSNSSIITKVLLAQCSFRIIAMVPVNKSTLRMNGVLMRNAWSGALLNLTYFMIVSHLWGALYYHMYILKLLECKHIVSDVEANAATLDWDQLLAACTEHDKFEIGMFSEIFTTKIATRSLTQKYVYCLSWGLKSLSSFGQIFSASSESVDTIFSFLTVVFGLILFGDLLARMQSGLQTTEIREGAQRTRQRMVEEWMDYHQLPEGLKRQIKKAIQSEWSATKGMNDQAIFNSLPWDLPPFEDMDDQLVTAICGHLRTFSINQGTYVSFEGEPVQEMIFIFSGELEVSCANNTGDSLTLGPGDLCGKELLEWCSLPTRSTENLPSSTQTVKCITDVDAFSLSAEDVKLLAIQFHRDGKFRHAFQHYAN